MDAPFLNEISDSSERTGSNIVLALDFPEDKPRNLLSKSKAVLEVVSPYVCAVKINRQLVLPLGLFDGTQELLQSCRDLKLPTIMDCKINDVGHTNRAIAEYYFKAGFNAVTASPFVGWDEGLQPVFEVAKQMRRGVIILVYMSHKGAKEGYGQTVCDLKTGKHVSQYVVFAQKTLEWNADGAVVGATFPEKIKEVHAVLGDHVPIYSPGVGSQGGDIEAAMKNGAHYLIVGRTIMSDKNPAKSAKSIRDTAARFTKTAGK
jgi:orotidine-5'-phosphate decarboxylase